MERLYTGYSELCLLDRFHCLIDSNAPYQGNGDSLSIEIGEQRFFAYAGASLCRHDWKGLGYAYGTRQYQQFPQSGQTIKLTPNDTMLTADINGDDSFLKQYLYRDPNASPDSSEHGFWGSMPNYRDLPIAYRAALICRYIDEHVVALPSDIASFVLGAEKTVETLRYIASPTFDSEGRVNGWTVRMRDLRPSKNLVEHIGRHLRGAVSDFERNEQDALKRVLGISVASETLRDESQLEEKPPRSTNSKTELMIEFVDNLVDEGVIIGRGGDMSWNDVNAKMQALYGDSVKSYTGDTLRDSYKSYKKRHPSQ